MYYYFKRIMSLLSHSFLFFLVKIFQCIKSGTLQKSATYEVLFFSSLSSTPCSLVFLNMGLAFTLTMSGSGILLLTFLQSHSHDCYDILWKCFFLSLSRMLLVSSPKINSEHMFSFNCLIRFQTVFAPPVFTDNLLCGA